MSDIFVGQTLEIEMTIRNQGGVGVDLSGVLTKIYCFSRPDGTNFSKIPGFVTDGTDFKLTYVTDVADLNMSGNWKVQALIVDSADGDYPATIVEFTVLSRLNC